MSNMKAFAVTRAALTLLGVSSGEIPSEWFNWRYAPDTTNINKDVVWRTTFIEDGNDPRLRSWLAKCTEAGFDPVLLASVAENPLPQELQDGESGAEMGIQPLSSYDEERNFLWRELLSDPDEFTLLSWAELRDGGGPNECARYSVPQHFWHYFGVAMQDWIAIEANADRIADSFVDVRSWTRTDTRLGVDDFDWENYFQIHEIIYVSSQSLPCCEIAWDLSLRKASVVGLFNTALGRQNEWCFASAPAQLHKKLSELKGGVAARKPFHIRLLEASSSGISSATRQGGALADSRTVLNFQTSAKPDRQPDSKISITWEQDSAAGLIQVMLCKSGDRVELRILGQASSKLPDTLTRVVQILPHKRDEWAIKRTNTGYFVSAMSTRILAGLARKYENVSVSTVQEFQECGVRLC